MGQVIMIMNVNDNVVVIVMSNGVTRKRYKEAL